MGTDPSRDLYMIFGRVQKCGPRDQLVCGSLLQEDRRWVVLERKGAASLAFLICLRANATEWAY